MSEWIDINEQTPDDSQRVLIATDKYAVILAIADYWVGDDNTIREALDRFELWLENHLEWRVSRMETRYTPAEYVCIGIEGYIDEDTVRHYKRHWRR